MLNKICMRHPGMSHVVNNSAIYLRWEKWLIRLIGVAV